MENLFISLFGSLILFDTTVAFQLMISQPLITCALLGWFLGDVQLGIQVGVFLQLLWLRHIPVGAVRLPEGNAAAIVTATLIIRYSQQLSNTYIIIFVAIILGILVSYIGGTVVSWFRKFNTFLLQKVIVYIKKGNLHTLSAINIIALVSHYILMFIFILVSINLGDLLFSYLYLLPAGRDVYFKYTIYIILGIGIGLVAPVFIESYSKYYLIAGILIGILIFFNL